MVWFKVCKGVEQTVWFIAIVSTDKVLIDVWAGRLFYFDFDEAWLALELFTDASDVVTGTIRCPPPANPVAAVALPAAPC